MDEQINIPFLKFQIDADEVKNLKLVKQDAPDPHVAEALYLFKNEVTGNFIGVVEADNVGGASLDADTVLEFAGTDFKDIQEIQPKHSDWFQTHYLYRIS